MLYAFYQTAADWMLPMRTWAAIGAATTAVIALIVVSRTLHLRHTRLDHRIDYWGAAALSVALVPLLIVAEAIEKDSPNVRIDTLAYQYTRKPPRTIRPRANVIIRLCSIECCFRHE